ncbi:hypothetical protein QBC38DRAFT_507535 [Podospora fimiseda]|uniref:HypA protein n=1 Tax=Podospora fimiseda TaxID=252190 RepID=A0AAN7BVZ4_9PEZI|nr:hypothetical protein QBC38DRAFT_507535 [Podospora fimiseda]
MHITPDNTGLWGVKQTEEAAKKVTDLLQEDMEQHHVFFNKDHFHNHIPHHLLALYGTQCTSISLIQKAYDNNVNYQRSVLPRHNQDTKVFSSGNPWPSTAKKYLGKEEFYPDFLTFFQSEIDKNGIPEVLNSYLFGDWEEMMPRLFGGALHPLIQLMYGMEWNQPAIVAEALAQTAVHSDQMKEYLQSAESRQSQKGRMGRMVDLFNEVRSNEKVSTAARSSDNQKIYDGVLERAKEEMISLASRVKIGVDEIEERTAEMFETCVYVAAAAARYGRVKLGKADKFDFFLMHHVNSSPIFVTINAQEWITKETKARTLEWKVRMDLLQYAARGVPELGVDKLTGYQPKNAREGESIQDIISRLHEFPDDGHGIKLGRAAVVCRNFCKKYEDQGKDWVQIQGDDTWKKVCHLIVDSVEAPGDTWVRSGGFDEAWEVSCV